MQECLFNTCSNNVCGYCNYHRCHMTVKQLRCKNCLGKNCKHLVKNEAHTYWKQREVTKQRRKKRKQELNDYFAKIHGGV